MFRVVDPNGLARLWGNHKVSSEHPGVCGSSYRGNKHTGEENTTAKTGSRVNVLSQALDDV